MRDSIHCARLLAFVTGLVRWAGNRIQRTHLPTRLRLSNPESPDWQKSANGSGGRL
jgi:hypothetical protein